ncbi:MAG: YHS domain-containing protein [Candidatus Lambdaproteobacteria bacterium]|nr:YHS domain-containing protein [Candidatus Lambdaproteobacteria bacterium]
MPGRRAYHFCTAHCLDRFRTQPERYVRAEVPTSAHVAGRAEPAGAASYAAPPTNFGGGMDNHQPEEEP